MSAAKLNKKQSPEHIAAAIEGRRKAFENASEEKKQIRKDAALDWYAKMPEKRREKALKAWETRHRNAERRQQEYISK